MNYALNDIDCLCSTHGCKCLSSSRKSSTTEPLIAMVQEDCPCNDQKIAHRLKESVERHLFKIFNSPKRIQKIFGKKISCAMNGVRIKIHVALLCNPKSNDTMQANFTEKRAGRKRVRRRKKLPNYKRV